MASRFYVPEARADDSTIELPEDEAAHLTRVLRLTAGDRVRVFNGRGDEWDALVQHANKQGASVRLVGRAPSAPETRAAITLAIAVLKGDKMDDVVRDAVMLGVTAIQPIVSARTEIALATIEHSGRRARWQRIAVSSAKQCGRAVVPDVRTPLAFADAMGRETVSILLVEPDSGSGDTRDLRGLVRDGRFDRFTVFVGPEGGWGHDEVQQARDRGAMLLTLGAQTLRADAVPIVALTALRVQLEDF